MQTNKTLSPIKYLDYRIYFLLIAFASMGMLITSPQSAGPDEYVHQSTAYHNIRHFIPTTATLTDFNVPNAVGASPCFAFHPEITEECMKNQNYDESSYSTVGILNYPPFFYWIIGFGQLIFSFFSFSDQATGGRLAGLFACLLITYVGLKRLAKTHLNFLVPVVYICLTPMALFLFATANPSGFEIATLILFVVELVLLLQSKLEQTTRFYRYLPLFFSCILACSARPSSFFWLSFITGFALWVSRQEINVHLTGRILISVIPGVFIGFAYFLTHRAAYQLPNFSPLESLSTKYLLYITFLDSTSSTFERLIQAYGQLGWLDTVPNTLIVVSLFIVWIFWVHKNFLSDRNMKFYFFLVVVSLILIIFAIEFSVARTWPHFWQGRYQLPVMIAFIILFSSLAGEKIVYNMNQIVFFTTMGIMYLLFLNFSRYHYGVNDGFPLRIHGGSTFELVIVTINLLLIFSLYFFGARKQLRFLKLH